MPWNPLQMTLGELTLWMLLLTAAGGLVAWALGRWVQALSATIAVIVSAVALGLGVVLYAKARAAGADAPFSLAPLSFSFGGEAAFDLSMRVTMFSGLIAAGAAFFALLTSIYSLRYARKQESVGRYYAYTLWALTGAVIAALANNLLLLLVGWEIVTLMLYLLVSLGGASARDGAAKTFTMLGVSDAALLLGVVLVGFLGGKPLHMDAYGSTPGTSPIDLSYAPGWYALAFLLFFVGASTKAGAMPFHTWLPSASEGAPLSVMAYLPASVDKLLGIYLLAFVSLDMFRLNEGMKWVLLIVGGVTILAAVMMALVQHDVRKLLSYHAVSQVGYMVLGVGTGSLIGIAGGLFHMVNHAIYKSCLFMSAGAVEDRTGETRIEHLGGLGRVMPVTFACMFVAAMAISGVPPMNGFVSKWLVYQGTLSLGAPGIIFLVVAVFGSALTLASFVKVLHAVFFGPKPEGMKEEPAGLGGRIALGAPMVVLALLCIGLGIFASQVLSVVIAPAMQALPGAEMTGSEADALSGGARAIEFTQGLWAPTTATILILAGIAAGLVVFFIGRGAKVRVQPPFTAGETLVGDDRRYLGTDFYKTIEELPVVGTVYRDAGMGVYDVYYLGDRFGGTLVRALRRIHSGSLPVYLSWGAVALTIISIYLFRYAKMP